MNKACVKAKRLFTKLILYHQKGTSYQLNEEMERAKRLGVKLTKSGDGKFLDTAALHIRDGWLCINNGGIEKLKL